MTAVAVIAIISAIGTFVMALRKLGPERDSLFITSAQGAAVIQNGVIETLREELVRVQAANVALVAENKRVITENETLRTENEGLKRRGGTRWSDQ